MELSEDQKSAFEKFCEWQKSGKKLLTLGGYLGTGKTSLIAYIKEQFPMKRIAFCSFTGKAALVLKSKLTGAIKLDDYIGTIHGLMYVPIVDKETKKIKGWRRQKNIYYDLIIIDEASMVDGQLFADLSSYGIPILAVGDHYQLPPINGEFNLMKNPDIKLETPHRFVDNMHIVDVCTMAREKGNIPFGEYGENIKKVRYSQFMKNDFEEYILSQDFLSGESIVVCGFNKTRISLNLRIRDILGHRGEPQANDRVICLKNNKESSPPIYNGSIGTLKRFETTKNKNLYFAEINLDGNEFPFYGQVDYRCFGNSAPDLFSKKKDDISFFDFGFCITTHKIQGSQYKNVLIIEQECDLWEHSRWLYTACGRSTKNLIIVK